MKNQPSGKNSMAAADGRRTSDGVIMHLAIQGCMKTGPIPYGLTADTGGHIRYLLELVEALSARPEVGRQIIVTRAFNAPELGEEYSRLEEQLSETVTLWRCSSKSSAYLPKEALWPELSYFTSELVQRIKQQKIHVNLMHAHYVDAGIVAMRVKRALDIPFIFTAHSLGFSKVQHATAIASLSKSLKRRLRYENLVIKHADRLIASSEHEARVQYGMYSNYDPSKVIVNPPGCDLQSIRSPASRNAAREVDATLKRFLRKPDLPCILAIARPVEKKNLCALIRAYGEHPELRNIANLVIFAGTRRTLHSEEPETRRVWQELLRLIDDYDLYGHVAYPKHHEFDQIPAIYQWAARRRGIFVNPALCEPFGLTLLEAAAAGLPVVATREGGPVDIIGQCQHGELIEPTSPLAIADACHRLLTSDQGWSGYGKRGSRRVGFYTWSRHVNRYISDMNLQSCMVPSADNHIRVVTQLLATDMDGTLLGDALALKRFHPRLKEHRDFLFVIATGRGVEDATQELKKWSAPHPDFLIADVGSSIYKMDQQGTPELLSDWHRHIATAWHRIKCERLLSQYPFLELQPGQSQTPYKLSYFLRADKTGTPENQFDGTAAELNDSAGSHEMSLKQIKKTLAAAGLAARVVYSHGVFVDILPEKSGKANAVEYLRKRHNIAHRRVVATGNSGNDADLLQYAALGIAVANHNDELESLRSCANLFWAQAECAGGILEGLELNGRMLKQPEKSDASQVPSYPSRAQRSVWRDQAHQQLKNVT